MLCYVIYTSFLLPFPSDEAHAAPGMAPLASLFLSRAFRSQDGRNIGAVVRGGYCNIPELLSVTHVEFSC